MEHMSTKETIIATGARIMLEKGYNNTGLQEVLKEARVPNGSFYHYFGSKEDFGLAVTDRYAQESNDFLAFHLDNHELPPLDRLRGFFEAATKRYDAEGCWGGCLMGNFGQELSDQNPVFRDCVATMLDDWRVRFAKCLKEAVVQGELREDIDPDALANFALDSWEGAILRMKVTKTVHPLERFIHFIFGTVITA